MMSEDYSKLDADMARCREELHANELKLAELRGQADGLAMASLSADKTLHELWRARAWKDHDPTLAITYDRVKDRIVGCPDGWPSHIENPTEHVAQLCADAKNAHMEKVFGARPDVERRATEDSPSVRALRRAMAE